MPRAKKKPAKKGGRARGQTSKAIAKSARKNGAKGGRPRDKLPDAVLAELGEPPATAKDLRLWCARLLAKITALSMTGGITHELASTLRANVKSVLAALPAAPPDDGDGQDEDEMEGNGPALEEDDEEFDGLHA